VRELITPSQEDRDATAETGASVRDLR